MRVVSTLLLSAASLGALGQSNIEPIHSVARTEFIGDMEWRPGQFGASINQYYCSGFLYGANTGWIQLGYGIPLDSIHYRNNSPLDFGVNVEPSGALRGFAYGANIGWLNFEPIGNPKVDWVTGKITGRVYSANTGWMTLDSAENYLRITSIAPGADTDNDGLPDAWEISLTGNLQTLRSDQDRDADGATDLQEYIAGTSPLDPNDVLGLLLTSISSASRKIEWDSKSAVIYRLEVRNSFDFQSPWQDAGYPPQVGNGNIMSLTLNAQSSNTAFYRLHAYPPLTQLN